MKCPYRTIVTETKQQHSVLKKIQNLRIVWEGNALFIILGKYGRGRLYLLKADIILKRLFGRILVLGVVAAVVSSI